MSATPTTVQSKEEALRSEIQQEWEMALVKLATALNQVRANDAAKKPGRKFTRTFHGYGKYDSFLDELARIGITYTEASGFSYASSPALWESAIQYSNEHSGVWFTAILPEMGGNEPGRLADEEVLNAALKEVENFHGSEVVSFTRNAHPDILNLNPQKETSGTTAETIDQALQQRINNYKEILKKITDIDPKDLDRRIIACQELIMQIDIDLQEQPELKQVVEPVLVEIKAAIRDMVIHQEVIKSDMEHDTLPLPRAINALATALVEFMEHPEKYELRIKAEGMAISLKGEVLQARKRSAESTIETSKVQNSHKKETLRKQKEMVERKLKIERLKEEAFILSNKLPIVSAEHLSLASDRKSKQAELNAATATKESLVNEKKRLEDAKTQAEADYDSNNTNILKHDETLKVLEKKYSPLRIEVTESLPSEIKKLTAAKDRITTEVSDLEKEQKQSVTILINAIDALVRDHKYLSVRSGFARFFLGGLESDAELARFLANTKKELLKNNGDPEKISVLAEELKQEIKGFLKNIEEMPKHYKASKERQDRLEQLAELCDKRIEIHYLLENRINIITSVQKTIPTRNTALIEKTKEESELGRHIRMKEKEKDVAEGKAKSLHDAVIRAETDFKNSSVHEELLSATTSVERLTTELSGIASNLASKETEKATIQGRLDAIPAECESHSLSQNEKTLTSDEIAALKDEIKSLDKEIKSAQIDLAQIDRDITALSKKSDERLGHLANASADNTVIKPTENVPAAVSANSVNFSSPTKRKNSNSQSNMINFEPVQSDEANTSAMDLIPASVSASNAPEVSTSAKESTAATASTPDSVNDFEALQAGIDEETQQRQEAHQPHDSSLVGNVFSFIFKPFSSMSNLSDTLHHQPEPVSATGPGFRPHSSTTE